MKYLLLILSLSFSPIFAQEDVGMQIAREHYDKIKADQKRKLNSYLLEQETTNGGMKFKNEYYGVSIEGLEQIFHDMIDKAETYTEYFGLEQKPKAPRNYLSNEEFSQLLVAATGHFQDGHHNTTKKIKGAWTLGLRTAYTQGKLIITGFDERFYTEGAFGVDLQNGDEIVEINNNPVMELASKRLPYTRMTGGTYESQMQTAMESLVSRSQSYLPALPKDETGVLLKVRRVDPRSGKAKLMEGILPWADAKKIADEIDLYSGLDPSGNISNKTRYSYGMGSRRETQLWLGVQTAQRVGFLKKGSVKDVGVLVNEHIKKELAKIENPALRASLPVAPVHRLAAYTVEVNGGAIGVLRIPSYSPNGVMQVIREFNWIAEVVEVFNNSNIDAVVIDQNANGGGYVFYGAHLFRLFSDDAGTVYTGTINSRLNQTFLEMMDASAKANIDVSLMQDFGTQAINDVEQIRSDLKKFAYLESSDPTNRKLLPMMNQHDPIQLRDHFDIMRYFGGSFSQENESRELYKKFKAMYEAGKEWTGYYGYLGTHNGVVEGQSGLSPNGGVETFKKPVVWLNDFRSGSGGDLVPNTLKANGKIMIAGSTSSGLGMPVFRSTVLPGSEMFTRNAYGFLRTANGLPTENLGAVPDVVREIFPLDIQTGFLNYFLDVFNMAYFRSQGKDAAFIQNFINKNQIKNLTGKAKLDPAHGKIFLMANKLKEQVSNFAVDDIPNLTEHMAKKYNKMYEDFNQKITDTVVADVEKNETLRLLKDNFVFKFPLPDALVKEDIVLAGQLRSRSVVDRLEMMLTLPRFDKRYQAKKLMRTLIKTFSLFENAATMNDCNSLFKAQKDFLERDI